MAEKGYFFNAMPDDTFETGYDRNYSADDISNWLRVAFTNGVVKTNNEAGTGNPLGLKVVADTGLTIRVNSGFACLVGKPYINDAQLSLTLDTAPTGANNRYDCIILRMDNTQTKSARRTYIYIKSLQATPTISDLERTSEVYELLLGYVTVAPNATSIAQADITDTRGNSELCPWFTAVKGYEDYYDAIVQQFEFNGIMASAGTTIVTNLASSLYNNKYSLIEVYCNGLKEEDTAYTISTSSSYITITFVANKSAGAKISVVLNNFIDGEGLSNVLQDYNNWVQAVQKLETANEFNYLCNGVNDNLLISNLVKAFYSVNDYRTMKLNIIGNFGMSAPVRGSGTSSDPYCWLDSTKQISTNRVATLDFSNCSHIRIAKTKNEDTDILTGTTSGKYSAFIRGEVINVIGLNLIFEDTTADTSFKVFPHQGGRIRVEICRFWLTSYKDTLIAYVGNFINCRGSVANTSSNSYCFMPYTVVKVEGGEYYAYTGDSTMKSAIIGQSTANSISILYGFNAPIVARSGFYQTNSILQWSGGGQVRCRDMITTLTDVIASGVVADTIAINKPNAL